MALNISCNIVASEKGRELVQHGSALFPIACYAEDLSSYSVAWHWHEEFEYVLCTKGPLHVDVNKTRLTLQTGQGVFINSGVLHAVEQAPEGTALLHSGVFHPRLVGGMDTIFWQKLIRPMTQPDAPPFFLLDTLVPWQKQVLDCLHESWKAVSDEPFDYENRVRYYLSLALRLLSTQCVGGRTKVSQQEQIASERMKQMLRFVEEHYAEELTVQLIAGSVALSESACLRSFRQMLGITPIQYVKQYRVEKAAELLRSTRLKTGEIGAECGFTDGSYFIKIFREIKQRCEKRSNLPHAAYIDIRPHHQQHPAVCPAPYVRKSLAADVQYRRHLGGRPLSRRRCAGGGRLVLHPHDLSDVHPAGPLHGQRRGHLDAVRQW